MNRRIRNRCGQEGITIVLVAGLTVMFVAFIALSVDIAHLMVVKNELKNAADAGALAGARRLYYPDGTGVNTAANQVASRAAIDNNSERIAVEVHDPDSNAGDVQRGHWSFATATFTPSNNTSIPDLSDVSSADLDADVTFVNAVKVKTRRQNTQANSFFARILGYAGFNASSESVAYLGFPGTLKPNEVDQPIAICRESILDPETDLYTCNTGRMLNSGSKKPTHNTAAWTNFSQPCRTASSSDMQDLICSDGNPQMITFGAGIGATGGVQDKTLRNLRDCFGPTTRTEPWNVTLPVIDCPGNNVSNCATAVGAVNINIVWISDKDDYAKDDFPPSKMGGWECPGICGSNRECCWNDFVEFFNLKDVDGVPATYAKKSIYFLPDCTAHETTGTTGGANYGILAEIPVLVN